MRFHEIAASYSIPDAYPYGVVLSIHPTLWSQLRRYVEASPEEFCILGRIQPEPDNVVTHVGCSTKASQSKFETAWG